MNEYMCVWPLTEFDHNSYGTDYVNVQTRRAFKIDEPLKFLHI